MAKKELAKKAAKKKTAKKTRARPPSKASKSKTVEDNLPAGLSQPALRALARAGYTSLAQLAKVDNAELLKLHGFGPKGIKTIRAALGRKG